MTIDHDLEHIVDTSGPDDPNADVSAASLTDAAASDDQAADPVDADATEPDPTEPEPVGELRWVDPAELIVGVNVRLDPRLDKDFIRSIRDRGVREVIVVRRREDGRLVVRKGKRRTLGAVAAEQARVRVLVEPDPEPTEASRAEQVERIVDQIEENVHRVGNTEVEVVAAHQELLDLGLSAGQIARRTHTPPKQVKVTTAVARSARATAALAEYDIPLDLAAVIAEFDDDTDDGAAAVVELTRTATEQPHQFDHVAQRLRDRRDDARLVAEHRAELTAAGVRVIDVDDDGNGGTLLSGLRPSPDDPAATELTVEGHASCPGHAADVAVHRGFDRAPQLRIRYWCTDPTGHGHAPRWATTTTPTGAAAAGDHTTGSGTPGTRLRSGGMTEQERAERRRVIENNKQWDSATTVRQRWLRHTFLARRTPPKDAAAAIATILATGGHDLRRALESRHGVARDLLGLPAPAPGEWPPTANPLIDAARAAATPARATMITLGLLLGAGEGGTSRDSWRHPTDDTRAYFTLITGWGYEASEVEQLVLNQPEPDTAPDPDTEALSPVEGLAESTDEPTGQPDDEPDQGAPAEPDTGADEPGDEGGRHVSDPDSPGGPTEHIDDGVDDGVGSYPGDARVA